MSGFSVCFLAGQQAFGQITTSDIVGTVSDATGAVVMNAKVAVTITATGDTRKQLSGSDGGFVFNPLLPGPYTVTVEAPSFSRMLSNVTVVAGDRARVDAQLLYCGGTVIAYVEAEGIDASGARVAESDIKRRRDRAMGHLL